MNGGQEEDRVRHLDDLPRLGDFQIRLAFQALYEQPSTEAGAAFLKRWYFWAAHSRLPPMIDAAHTVKRHRDGILRWFQSRIANGLIEGINSLVQAAKAKACGYRSIRNLKAMVYLLTGKLDLKLPAGSRYYPHIIAKNHASNVIGFKLAVAKSVRRSPDECIHKITPQNRAALCLNLLGSDNVYSSANGSHVHDVQ